MTVSPIVLGRVSLWRSALVLLRMSWARTMTPVLMLAMLALVFLPMLFALVFASRGALSGDPVPFLMQRYDQLVCALATPVIALLLGTSAFSAEADDGTLLYLVSTTTPRWWITFVRVAFASVGTALLSAFAVWGTGKIATGMTDPQGVTRACPGKIKGCPVFQQGGCPRNPVNQGAIIIPVQRTGQREMINLDPINEHLHMIEQQIRQASH